MGLRYIFAVLPLLALALVVMPTWQAATPSQALDFSVVSHYPYPIRGFADAAKEVAFYRNRLKLDPSDGSLAATLARIYWQEYRKTEDPSWLPQAEQAAKDSLANKPYDNADAHLILGDVACARGDYRSAMKTSSDPFLQFECELALGQVPGRIFSGGTEELTWQALALEAQGDDDGVVRTMRKALASEREGDMLTSAWSRVMFGRFFFRQGHYTLAADFYREALRIFPNYPLGLRQQAELETVLGEFDRAEQHYREAGDSIGVASLRHQPVGQVGGSGRELACYWLERGDASKALPLMQEVTRQRRDWLTLDLYAWALQASHQPEQALAVEKEALTGGVHSAQAVYRKSELEDSLGMKDAAQQDRALALQYNPNFRAAHAAVPFMW